MNVCSNTAVFIEQSSPALLMLDMWSHSLILEYRPVSMPVKICSVLQASLWFGFPLYQEHNIPFYSWQDMWSSTSRTEMQSRVVISGTFSDTEALPWYRHFHIWRSNIVHSVYRRICFVLLCSRAFILMVGVLVYDNIYKTQKRNIY